MHDGLALAPADRIHAGKHVPTPRPLFTITLRARRYVMPKPHVHQTPRDVPRERRDTSVPIAPNARMEQFAVNAGARRTRARTRHWKPSLELGTRNHACTCACGSGGAGAGAGCSTLSIKSRHTLPQLFVLSFSPLGQVRSTGIKHLGPRIDGSGGSCFFFTRRVLPRGT